ncbi:hypothetical protein PP178_09565 [Zeaxanthinibacter sp. PT1]|uniref:hypothetical protein n=1 Tax=Zeaxanthinibacter TaxID=561554 RepID=UPI00234AD9BE|nr:hypothetical protein [Zeaxanthinibacter sp. PT1]MDC6351804.1 hypothetical protein [Zeaxanthinibacter sp. PT1]
MRYIITICLGLLSWVGCAQSEESKILSKEIQIKTAVLPLPDGEKEGAMVYGYNEEGSLVVFREGTNNMVCLADDPTKEGISVSCYSKALEPFMARGRELSAQGADFNEKTEIRGKEVAEGKLKMPEAPSMTYIYYGKDEDYDKSTGELANGKFRYVIYIPFATTESTGLPDKPHAPGMPWLMDPGTHRAHIMVGPF